VSASNIELAGQVHITLNGSNHQTSTMNWTGSAWVIVSSPNAAGGDNYLETASKEGTAGEMWSVGNHHVGSGGSRVKTLIEEFHC
jgi:hypothetical protein